MNLLDEAIDFVEWRVSKWGGVGTSRAKDREAEAQTILTKLIAFRTALAEDTNNKLVALGYRPENFRPREWDVLNLLMIPTDEPPTTYDLASRLCITEHTVYVYLARIKKVGGRLVSVHGRWRLEPIGVMG